MKLNQLLTVVLLLVTSIIEAQPKCGFDVAHKAKLQQSEQYRQNVATNEESIRSFIAKNKDRLYQKVIASNSALYKIPVAIHVIHTGGAIGSIYNPDDTQIEGALNYLNEVYNGTYPGTSGAGNIEIQFVLPERAANCSTTTGINRIDASGNSSYVSNGVNSELTTGVSELVVKNLSRWDPSEYYNIWIVNKIDGKDGTFGSFIAGYAYFPGAHPLYDGTIMLATQMQAGRKTLPHEIGHAFGLYHPFQGQTDSNNDGIPDQCSNNTNPSLDGDMVTDTDPVLQPMDFSCRTGTNLCNGLAFNDNTERNYMNYTSCYNLFTAGQKARMLAAAASIFRKSLSTSAALTPANIVATFNPPVNATSTPATGTTGLSGVYAGIINVSLNNRNFYSSDAANDNGYVNYTNSCIKLIPLVAGNTYSIATTVYGWNNEYLNAWIDFNNDGSFTSEERIQTANNIPNNRPNRYVTITSSFPVPSTATLNTVLRMRVIDDLNSFNSASHNPVYGQAEDFAVYISPSTLPITLNNFDGRTHNKSVLLSWNTTYESNTSHFEIEKSLDGTHYYKIGEVKATGNSTSIQEYSFEDRTKSAVNFYRLKIFDKDRKFEFSKTILIKLQEIEQSIWLSSRVFTNRIEVNFNQPAKKLKLEMISSNGTLIDKIEIKNPNTKFNWEINNTLISTGLYILKVSVDNNELTEKIIKQ